MLFEKWDILDQNGNSLGKTVQRSKVQFKPGEYHLVVHIWVVSSDGNILIQRRADSKREMPGQWAANGGCAIAGETSLAAARRELSEELGIECDDNALKKVLRLRRRNSLIDIWVVTTDLSLDELKLQETEVAEAKWVTMNELKCMIKCGKFHNYGSEYFEKVFCKIKNARGVC